MLRSISICNFVHFEDPQVLEFEQPVNFIIGGNSTGKTSIFELIRRCYSPKLSTTKSSIPNENKLAYVICIFEITQPYPKLQVDKDKENPIRVVSFLFAKKNDSNSSTNVQKRYWYKGVSLIYQAKNCLHTYLSQYEVKCDLTKTAYGELKFRDLHDFSDIKSLETVANEFFFEISKFQETDLPHETMLKDIYEWLENGYVGVFPMRSIGPLQWTRSPNFKLPEDEMKAHNYAEAFRNAEILHELLGNEKIADVENKYHQILVYPFTFKKENGTIMVHNELDNTDRFNILKTPEGILEAKQLTLILAHSEFNTITLEEPDRGMHIHMVKKVRDFILKRVTGKTVIIITHNPAFMDQWSMSRCFVCSQSFKGKTVNHNVRKIPQKYTIYGSSYEEEMKSVIFSSRILFVEGITDKIMIQAAFRLLICNDETNQNLKDYILSIDIHELQSASKGNSKTALCKELLKEFFILYDSDVFMKELETTNNSDEKKQCKVNGKKKGVIYNKTFASKDEFLKEENFSEFALKCERANIFAWKNGALENQIINLLKDRDPSFFDAINNIFYLRVETKPEARNVIETYINKKDKDKEFEGLEHEIVKTLKRNLKLAYSEDIDIVANALIKSDEGQRLIDFIRRKMQSREKEKEKANSDESNWTTKT